jgi:hypothetical protein
VARAGKCFYCGIAIDDGDRLVLMYGDVEEEHCSEPCLRATVRRRRIARARTQIRWFLRLSFVTLVVTAGAMLWQRHRVPQPQAIAYQPPDEVRPEPAPAGPIYFGPAWPPTDDDWIAAFDRTSGTYPLPGPVRRPPAVDARILGLEAPKNHPPLCREPGRCAVDLGGELWGEHVYAALDGVVDRVHRGANEEHGGVYVRLAHLGGMAFTQYFHLAAVPRGLTRGTHVKAGDVIGLLGDTGTSGGRHLCFALSVRPSPEFSEVYWDPRRWMARWALRLPAHGTVAGFVVAERPGEMPPPRHPR